MPDSNSMPMGAAAMKYPLSSADLMPPMPVPIGGAQMAQAYPPDNALTMQGAPPPAAPKPAPFPYDVRLQADGSSVYFLKGSDVILAVNKIPKVAPALQPPPQQPMA